MTPVTRRSLVLGAGLALLGRNALAAGLARGGPGELFVGCRIDEEERCFVTGFEASGALRFDLPLPDRGHGIAFHPSEPHGVVFARRPGRFAVVLDHAVGTALRRIDSAPGRHFYGHGVFTPDGRHLLTTENAYETGDGVIGIRDTLDGYRQIGEIGAHGIGPHDLALMPGGQSLAVANGGIRTHPDYDRRNLNVETMRPNLAFVELMSGRLHEAFELAPELHKLSIRHIDRSADGRVAIAMQHEGGKQEVVPLVGLFEGGRIRLFEQSAEIAREMRHYAGSIAFDVSGSRVAVTCPRGNAVTVWDAASGQLLHKLAMTDGCGVAPLDTAGFIFTGRDLERWSGDGLEPMTAPVDSHGSWDNHLAAMA